GHGRRGGRRDRVPRLARRQLRRRCEPGRRRRLDGGEGVRMRPIPMRSPARRGVHGQTVEIIAQRILSGEIAEGDTLNITQLQDELGVSLTALREALKVLTAKGLVDARQKRGTFVRPRSDWQLLDAEVIRWQFAERANPQLL